MYTYFYNLVSMPVMRGVRLDIGQELDEFG